MAFCPLENGFEKKRMSRPPFQDGSLPKGETDARPKIRQEGKTIGRNDALTVTRASERRPMRKPERLSHKASLLLNLHLRHFPSGDANHANLPSFMIRGLGYLIYDSRHRDG